MEKRYLIWIAVVVALIPPAIVLAKEGIIDFHLAYNDNLGKQGELPVVKTGSQVYYPSGTYYFSETDLKVAARSIPMVWERTYRSNRVVKGDGRYVFAEPADGPLGYGWTTPFTVRIENDAFVNAEGRYIYFEKDANGNYLPNQEAGYTLKKTAEGYALTELGGNTHLFNPEGNLIAIRDTRGHSAVLTYDAEGRLVAIADVMGREIYTFIYTAENRIARVTDLAGRAIDYGYDPLGNLELVSHDGQVLARYSYNTYHGITSKANALDETYSIEYRYTDKGVVSKVIDPVGTALIFEGKSPEGHLMSFKYDFQNRVYYVTDQLGVVRKCTLNSAGNVTSETDIIDGVEQPKEKVEYLENRVTKTTDALGNVTLTQRDEWGNVIKKVDAAGYEWRYAYNTHGRITSETDPLGTVNQYEWDENGNKVKEVVAAGTEDESVTAYAYNEFNELTSVTHGEAVQKFEYDEAGNLTSKQDPLGNDVTLAYDQLGNVLSQAVPLVGVTKYEDYDFFGNSGKVTDPNGNVILGTFDLLGRLTTVTNQADGGVTKYLYGTTSGGNCTSCSGGNASGKVSGIIFPEGDRIDYQYDAAGNLAKITDGEGNSIVYTYNDRGNQVREEIFDTAGALQKYVSREYDPLDRLQKTINPDGGFTEFGYTPRGNKASLKNPNGHVTAYTYDAVNRLVKETQPGEIVTSYTYDRRGNLESVTDANANVTTYTYDARNRLTKTVSSDSGTTTYAYDRNGNLRAKTDAKGVTATYSYDAAKRLTGVSFPDPVDNVIYGYDDCVNGKGRLCTVTDPSGVTTYEYTLKGEIAKEIKVIDGKTYTIGYTYDKNGNLEKLKYPSGRVVTYTFANNRVTGILADEQQVAADITYKPFGDVKDMTYGSGIQHTVKYDQQYRTVRILDSGIQDLAYNYDYNNNIIGIIDQLDQPRTKSYGYDPLDRLASAQGPWGALAYTYDGVGNRLKESNGGETTYRYENNRLLSAAGEKNYTFTYDQNGNTTVENAKTFVYNQNQRLIKVAEGEIIKGEYVYNASGQRAKKVVNGQSTLFFYDPQGKLLAETGATITEYLYFNGNSIAKAEGSSIYYFHTDHLGTPLKITDADKGVVWAGEYKPFGEAISVNGNINNIRFPGQYFDAEINLHQNWFRNYMPAISRYIESDPIGLAGGINPFIYAIANPIVISDPTGLSSCWQISPWERAPTIENPGGWILFSSRSQKKWRKTNEFNTLPIPGRDDVVELTCGCSWQLIGYEKVSTYYKEILLQAKFRCRDKCPDRTYEIVKTKFDLLWKTTTEWENALFNNSTITTYGFYDRTGACSCPAP